MTDVRVEGMMTVMDADAKRAAFEARVLTPAKVRELEKHIDAQLAHPAMGFDVDVLQLEYQRVTGFEAVSDDAVRLREMLQDVVAKEKEKALAAAGGNKHLFSPETRRAVDAAEAAEAADAEADVSTAAAQDLEQVVQREAVREVRVQVLDRVELALREPHVHPVREHLALARLPPERGEAAREEILRFARF